MNWTGEITKAAERINGHVQITPVLLTQGFGLTFPIEMKLEHMQHTGSFKARGAFNTLLSSEVPEAGLVAARPPSRTRLTRALPSGVGAVPP